MHIKEFLEVVCTQIKYKPIRNDIKDELNLHIQEAKENLILEEHLSEEQAEEKAVSNMGDALEIGKKLNKIHRPKLDWVLLILVGILIGFGLLVSVIRSNSLQYSMNRHISFLIIGFVIGLCIYFANYRKLLNYSNLLYILSSVIILATIFLGGHRINSAYVYFTVLSRNIMPVYICAYLYILAFAGYLSNFNKNSVFEYKNIKIKKDLAKIILLSSISIILMYKISTFVFVGLMILTYIILFTAKIIYLKENIKINLIKLYSTLIVIGILCCLFIYFTRPYIYYRIKMNFTVNHFDEMGAGYIGYNINKVLDSSKPFEKSGVNEQVYSLFDSGTDYALISIISNYGYFGAGVIVISVILLCIKLIVSAKQIKDIYGKMLIIGLSSIILLQSISNILMNFNLGWQGEVSLPFVSFGCNGLLINMISIALILSIYRRKDILIKEDKVIDIT